MSETKINASQTTITAEDIGAAPVYDTMPTAAVGYLDKIVQYTGTTDSTYTNGYFYKCVSDGDPTPTYSWTAVQVQGGLPSQTGNAGKFLTTDGTDASWGNALQDMATQTSSLAIGMSSNITKYHTVVIGKSASVTSGSCIAIGEYAKADGSGAISICASDGGYTAKAHSVIIGGTNNPQDYQVRIGKTSGYSYEPGYGSIVLGEYQFGSTTNAGSGEFWVCPHTKPGVYDSPHAYKLLDSDGTIPTDRYTATPSADGTYVPTLSISSGVATRSWDVPSKITDYISNCITEIPQDINLELSSGTLTLKSGSKVYVPNGDGVFDTITTAADKTLFDSSVAYNDKVLVCYNSNNNTLVGARFGGTNTIGSGTIADRPAASSMSLGAGLYYATDENILYIGNKGTDTWTAGASLPIAIVSVASGVGCTSINQVFNGFGYIGSTVFALPGVKGLIPNGRNADGTLKSTEITISNVLTTTDSSGATGGLEYYLSSTSINRANFGTYFYDTESNNIVDSSGVRQNSILIDPTAYRDSGKVSSFIPKYAFHAVDYNDTDFIANCAMPSDRYIELTLGTSPFNVTAPADGYVVLAKNATTAGYEVRLKNQSNLLEVHDAAGKNNQDLAVSIPCSKGQVVRVYYSADGTTGTFRFVYANGAK